MNKLKLILGATVMSIAITSCQDICVRCESGTFGETDNECFLNEEEKDEFIESREALGYTCTTD